MAKIKNAISNFILKVKSKFKKEPTQTIED